MHKWTNRDNWQWYGWWRCDDFIWIFESGPMIFAHCWPVTRVAIFWHVWHVSGWWHSVSPPGTTCHPTVTVPQQKLPSSGLSQVIPPSLATLYPSPHTHELWQYQDIIYLTKTNNRSTLQSKPSEQRGGTREFNNWFNARLHNKAKDFAKRWGQKQVVHSIICQARHSAAQREISVK